MKLVGATDWFIRWPFVIEGIVLGALGGLLAIAAAGRRQDRAASIRSSTRFSLLAAPETIHFGLLVGVLLLASVGGQRRRLGPVAAPLPARLTGT